MSQMPKTETEVHVKTRVKRLLDEHRWYWFSPPANAFGKSGIADILAVKAGMFLAIETKYHPNKPTPMQKRFLARVASESHFAVCVNEKMIDDLAQFLDAVDIAYTDATKGQPAPTAVTATMDRVLRNLTAMWMEKLDGAQDKPEPDRRDRIRRDTTAAK